MWTCMRRLQNDSLQKLKGPHSSRPLANYHHSQPTWNRSTLTKCPVSNPSLDPVRQSTAQHCRNSEGEEIFFAIAFRSLNKKEKKPVPYSAIQRFHRSAVRLSSNANSITGLCQILQGTAIEFSHGVIRSSRSILQRSSLEEFQYVAAFIVLSCYPAADRWAKSF